MTPGRKLGDTFDATYCQNQCVVVCFLSRLLLVTCEPVLPVFLSLHTVVRYRCWLHFDFVGFEVHAESLSVKGRGVEEGR